MHTLVCASNTVYNVSLLWQGSNGCVKGLGTKTDPIGHFYVGDKMSLFCRQSSSRWHCHQQRCSRLADEIINEHFYFLYTDLKVVWLMFSELRNQNEDFEEDSSGFIFLCLANCVFSFSFQYRKTRYCWSQTKHSYPSGGWHEDVQVSRIYVKSALELSLFWQCSGRVTGSIPEV